MAALTHQYLEYVEMKSSQRFSELAAEYLLMAAMLIEIKSRMLFAAGRHRPRQRPIRAQSWSVTCWYEQMAAAAGLDELPQAGATTPSCRSWSKKTAGAAPAGRRAYEGCVAPGRASWRVPS